MATLNGVGLPAHYNGIGCHDTPGCYVATFSYKQAKAHAQELKAHGVTLYKLLVSGGNKVDRAQAYVDNGVLPIVRDWVYHPWGRPPAAWVMPADQIKMYADVGVQLFEIAGNEWNIEAEWQDNNIPNDPAKIAQAAVDAFEVALNNCAQFAGAYPLFPSNTPGGNVDHRLCYQAIVAELNMRGLMDAVKHVAIHPRPHNNPPDVQWSATNTVTFDEWRWIRDQFPAGVYFWATEHGYSLNDDQNHDYPRIDLPRHTDYNWQLDLWMNGVIEPQLAGFCHWIEAGWGHWGAWGKDALRDSNVPEMPAPSPLWIRMGEQAQMLNFERYVEPPLVVNPARGFDCSAYQGEINWDLVAKDYTFVFIRASRATPQYILEADRMFARNYEAAGAKRLLRGAYHTLRAQPERQAAFFFNTVGDRKLELGYYGSIELHELSAYKCQLFLEAMDGWIQKPDGTGIYTRATIFDKFGTPAWAVNRNLWVAHYRVPKPNLPKAWDGYEFWQTGQSKVAGKVMDVNIYCGDEEALYDKYAPELPLLVEGVKILDLGGIERDWAWVQASYGQVEIEPIAGDGYRVIQLMEVEGITGFTCTILNARGRPVIGQQVAYIWPGGEALEVTSDLGVAEHTPGFGEGYWPATKKGPISWEVRGATSERISGLGWVYGTNQRHLQVTMRWTRSE